MNYAIAYKDKNGNGFGEYPFVIDDYNDLNEASKKKDAMLSDGFKDVTLFIIGDDCQDEVITWEYVDKNKV